MKANELMCGNSVGIKDELNPNRNISIPISVIEDICRYCETQAIYDKLSNYGDFYYKIKKLINK